MQTSSTTSTINLKRIVFNKDSPSRILDPTKMAGKHHVLTSMESASTELRKYAIPLEEGPYSDMEGVVGRLCGHLVQSSPNGMSYVEKVARAVTDERAFSLNDTTVLSDGLTTAGSVLADDARSGHISLSCTHILEPYMLATSLLRRNGFECYPALAIIGHGEFDPVLAIMGIDDSPFAILSLSEVPPPMHTLELISDMAMLGATHAMAAENIARLLARRTIAMMQLEGEYPSEEEVHLRVEQMGNSLFECGMHWPKSPFIGQALDFLRSKMTKTYSLLAAASLSAHANEIPEHLIEDQINMFSRCAFFLASGLEVMVKDHIEHKAAMHSISEVN
jgi:hypothetical protein